MHHLEFILFICLVTALQACYVYIDSNSGTDEVTCGARARPCRTIAKQHVNQSVCLSPGIYKTDFLPSVLSRWDSGTSAKEQVDK